MTTNQKGFSGLLVLALCLVIAATGFVGYTVLGNHKTNLSDNTDSALQKTNYTITPPTDWKDLDTGFGFNLKLPTNWTNWPVSTSTYNGRTEKSFATINKDSSGPSVLVGSVELSDTSEKAFTAYTQGLSKEALAAYAGSARFTTQDVMINGSHWYQTQLTAQSDSAKGEYYYYRTLYRWNQGHNISLGVDSKSAAERDKLTAAYLLPMAASLK